MEDSTWKQMETRRYESAKARKLEEAELIRSNLDHAYHSMALYRDWNSEGEDTPIPRALFDSALLAFMACFDESHSHRVVPEAAFSHLTGWQEAMQHLKDLRDSHAAHMFGSTRQSVTTILINADDPTAVEGIGVLMMSYVGLAKDDDMMLRLIAAAIEHVNEIIEQTRAEALAEAQALSREALDKLDPNPFATPPAPGEVRVSRTKFEKMKREQRARREAAGQSDQIS